MSGMAILSQEVQQAGVEWVAIAILAGLSAAAQVLLRPKPKSPVQDKEPTTLATRGAYIPWIIGIRRTGAVFGWAGNRQVRQDGGTGGKGGGKGAGGGINTYYEAGWHQICVGPASALYRIWQDGKVILDLGSNPLTPGTSPSGASYVLPNRQGTFRLYWGEAGQPIDPLLQQPTSVGIASRWPFLCHIVWDQKRLGPAPRWPNLEYEIGVLPFGTTQVPGMSYLPRTAPANYDDGVNPAHIIEHLLHQPFPHGVGRPRSEVETTSLVSLGSLAEAEHLACSVVARDGATAESILAPLLQDVGAMVPYVEGRVRIVPIRPEAPNWPILTDDHLLQPRPEIEKLVGEDPADQIIYAFHDREHFHRENTFNLDDDGQASMLDSKTGKKVGIESTVNFLTAALIADRRAQEDQSSGVGVRIYASRAARTLHAGQQVTVAGIPILFRVASVQPDPLSGRTVLEVMVDYYSVDPTGFLPTAFGNVGVGFLTLPVPDVGFTTITPPKHTNCGWTPPMVTGLGSTEIAVPRIRGHANIYGAEVHVSLDGTSYYRIGTDLGYAAGGELLGALPGDGPHELEHGPIYQALGPDDAGILDLTSDPAQWRLGRQLAIIGSEVFYLRGVEALGGGQFKLRGLLRARDASRIEAHPAGALVLILESTKLPSFQDPALIEGATIHVKTIPFNDRGGVDPSEIEAATYTIPQHLPFGPVALRTDPIRGHPLAVDASAGVVLRWEHVSPDPLFPRTGAGQQAAGDAVQALAPVLGVFELEVGAEPGDVVPLGSVTSPHALTVEAIETALGASLPNEIVVRMRETVGSLSSPWTPYLTLHRVG